MRRIYICEAGHVSSAIDTLGVLPDSKGCHAPLGADEGDCPYTAHLQPIEESMQPKELLLADVGLSLGIWIGDFLPGLQRAMDEINADGWAARTKLGVQRQIGNVLLEDFEEKHNESTSPEILNAEAELHLARFVVSRARAIAFETRHDAARSARIVGE